MSTQLPQALSAILAQNNDAQVALGKLVEYLRHYSGADFTGLINCSANYKAVTVSTVNDNKWGVQITSPSLYGQLDNCLKGLASTVALWLTRTQSQAVSDHLDTLQQNFLNELIGPVSVATVETCLILPLALSSQLGGWLVLTWDVACPCNGDLIDQLGSALPTLAIALRQYYQGIQLDNLQTALEQRDQQLQHSLGQQRRLQAQTQKQVAQLRYVNQLKDDFLNTTSHELRTPLTSMTLAIRMLRRTDITPERHLAYLDILEQQCNREIALINDLLKLRQLEANELSTQVDWVQPKAVLEGLLADHQPYFQKASLSLQLTLPQQIPPLQTDPDSLWQILNELLINARKYAQSGSTVDLTVEVDKPMSSALKIMVSNWGTGILPEEIPFIFDKFRRGRDATQQAIQGTGLGLALVKALVTSLNSTITVNSQPVDQSGTWLTQFVLLIPLRQQGILPLAEG
ncbi:MAG: HAMP domain-containing sensor histidine kinase [Cyanobacteria bacterium P01_A01_bin.123]